MINLFTFTLYVFIDILHKILFVNGFSVDLDLECGVQGNEIQYFLMPVLGFIYIHKSYT